MIVSDRGEPTGSGGHAIAEARRNLRRNPGEVVAVVLASAAGGAILAGAIEWYVDVGKAHVVTFQSEGHLKGPGQTGLSITAGQLGVRIATVAVAALVCILLVSVTTWMATSGRRREEAEFFEMVLGASIRRSALLEGAICGTSGGLVAALVAVAAAPAVATLERSQVPMTFTVGIFKPHVRARILTVHLDPAAIGLPVGTVAVIAASVLATAAGVAVLAASTTVAAPAHRL